MIVIEGTFWPVLFLGVADERAIQRADTVFVTERVLEMSERLAMGLVVGGTGDRSMRSQLAVLDWLERHQDLLGSRVLRLAWVIEDERVRASTNVWLRCMRQTVFTVRSVTFRTVTPALSWLLETPWPLNSAPDGREPMQTKVRTPARSKREQFR